MTQEEPALPPGEPPAAHEKGMPEGAQDRENENAGPSDALTIRALLLSGAILLAITVYWVLHRH